MPLVPINYSKTIIYKIVSLDPNIKDCYIGSTTDFFKRKANHKHNCYNEKGKKYNFKLYEFIRANGDWNNFDMIMIETYPCENSLQAHQRERHHFESLGATLNAQVPSRSKSEYAAIYNKNYHVANRDKRLEYLKQYRLKQKLIKQNNNISNDIVYVQEVEPLQCS